MKKLRITGDGRCFLSLAGEREREVSRAEADALFPPHEILPGDGPAGPPTGCWPQASNALMVHPSQIEDMRAKYRAAGVLVDFTPKGEPILEDRAHRKRVLKAAGMVDFDGVNGG